LDHCGIGLKIEDSGSCYKTLASVRKISTKLTSNFENEE